MLQVDEQKLLVFIISTYTNGAPPEPASWFYNWLQESVNDFRVPKTLLKDHRFAVFGLGNSLYHDDYNTVSKSPHSLYFLLARSGK